MSTPKPKKLHKKPRRSSRSSGAGLRGVNTAIEKGQTEIVSLGTYSIKAAIVTTVVVVGLGIVYYKIQNRFVKRKLRSDLPPANISDGEAQSRAAAIYGSIGWFSNNFETVRANIAGLNYNGFIKLYNAFGHHTGTLLSGDLDLEEWVRNQFTIDEVRQLSALLNGAFFKV